MPTPLALDMYLNKLDRSLGYISVSEKAEIIINIKKQILEKMASEPNQKLETILSSLGSPQAVANRCLIERGLKPVGSQKLYLFKWLSLGLVGTVGILCITILIIMWKFSPLIELNNGQIKFFGGLVDLDDDLDWNIQGFGDEGFYQSALAGSHDVKTKSITELHLEYNNASIWLATNKSSNLEWKCVTSGAPESPEGVIENGVFQLDFKNTGGAKCKFKIPKDIRVSIRGGNGALSLDQPHFPVEVDLDNASVKIKPDRNLKYRFDLKVKNGKVDNFTSFDGPDAIELKMSLQNGMIVNK